MSIPRWIRTCVPNLVLIGPAIWQISHIFNFGPDRTTDGDVYTLGRIHTQTHTLLYRYRWSNSSMPCFPGWTIPAMSMAMACSSIIEKLNFQLQLSSLATRKLTLNSMFLHCNNSLATTTYDNGKDGWATFSLCPVPWICISQTFSVLLTVYQH